MTLFGTPRCPFPYHLGSRCNPSSYHALTLNGVIVRPLSIYDQVWCLPVSLPLDSTSANNGVVGFPKIQPARGVARDEREAERSSRSNRPVNGPPEPRSSKKRLTIRAEGLPQCRARLGGLSPHRCQFQASSKAWLHYRKVIVSLTLGTPPRLLVLINRSTQGCR